jgi:DNA invertase Pin-like site-specific DNA recombinase
LGHLIEVVRGLSDRGIGFKSIQESLDTTTSGGRLIFHVFGAIAEFERDLQHIPRKSGTLRPVYSAKNETLFYRLS